MRERRREAQPSGIKTFGSTFKNPEDERAEGRIGRAAARGGRLPRPARRRRPLLREARQLRRERPATATTADVLELMAEGRRRVHERFGVVLEPEVQVLGEVELAGRLGAVRRPGDRRRLLVAVVALVAVYWFVAPRHDGGADPTVAGAAAGGDDRRRRRSGRRRRRRRAAPLAAAARGRAAAAAAARRAAEGRPASRARRSNRCASSAPSPTRCAPTSTSSCYGESGVDVELTSGIELRFGDASQARREVARRRRRCWPIPSITALDYVDLHAPSRPDVRAAPGHELPPRTLNLSRDRVKAALAERRRKVST